MRIAVAFVSVLVLLVALTSRGLTAAPESAIPSSSATDGLFLALANDPAGTASQPIRLWLTVPADETALRVRVFDGDLGGRCAARRKPRA